MCERERKTERERERGRVEIIPDKIVSRSAQNIKCKKHLAGKTVLNNLN